MTGRVYSFLESGQARFTQNPDKVGQDVGEEPFRGGNSKYKCPGAGMSLVCARNSRKA